MASLGPSDWLWKPDTGYYTESAEDIFKNPYLPDQRFLQDRRLMSLFNEYGKLSPQSEILEIGCGRRQERSYLTCRPA